MDRYENYARDVRPISGLPYSRDIPPLREFPLKDDPRRERSYRKVLDLERSREDQPLLELSTDVYKLRRIVVPATRSQCMHVSRIPNARDPRGLQACKRRNLIWVPTLVENSQVLQEEETCAVLVIDVSEWESTATKSSYIEIIPHECNVQRALEEAHNKLAKIDDGLDGLLMSAEEAEKHMQAATPASNRRLSLDDSDVQECDSDGEVLTVRGTATGFVSFEDRPMLEVCEGGLAEDSVDGEVSWPRHIDDDEDEDKVIYLPEEVPQVQPVPKPDDAHVECINLDIDEAMLLTKKELQASPVPQSNDADIECIDLDLDIDLSAERLMVPKQELSHAPPLHEPNSNDVQVECIDLELDADVLVVPKQKAQEVQVPFDKNIQREVQGVVTLSDSHDEDEDELNLFVAIGILWDEMSKSIDSYAAPTCSDDTLPPDASKQCLLGNPPNEGTGETNIEGEGFGGRVTEQMPLNNIEGHDVQNSDCVSEAAIGNDINKFYAVKNNRDGNAAEQSAVGSVGFSVATSETSAVADEAHRSNDSDSNVSTTTQLKTQADVHVPTACEQNNDDELIARSEICEMQEEHEETVKLANTPAVANIIMQKRKRRKSNGKRWDTATNTSNACEPEIAKNKRCKKNDENKSDNCNAVVVRVPSPVFTSSAKKRRSRKKFSVNVLQLSTSVILKPSVNTRPFTLFSNFNAFGILYEYLKTYTATYNSINYFAKYFEKVSVHEFLRANQYVKSNNFWQNRYNYWHRTENNACLDVTGKRTFNQLARTDSPSSFRDDQMASVYEVIQPIEHKTVIASTSTTWNQKFVCEDKDVINTLNNSWLAQENGDKDGDGKIKLQRRHSLPMKIVPQQNHGTRRPRLGSVDNTIKLTLRKSQVNENAWVATAGTSTMPNISAQCTLSISNNSAQNGQTIANKDSISEKQSLIINKPCTYVNKILPKWPYIDKEVPELDIDDCKNRPLPQIIHFDSSKLSLFLQSRVKRRSTSVDSAIVSDLDDSKCKRRKLTDSTIEYEFSENNFNDCDDKLLYSDYTRKSLEIRELSPYSCIELSKPTSVNICNLNNNNNEDTCENSENQKLCNLEDLPKSCFTNAVIPNEQCLNLDENNATCLENVNQYLQNDNSSSDSDTSFHLEMEDEPEDSSNTVESHEPNIRIDYSSNLQKDLNSLDHHSGKISNAHQDERHLIERLENQKNSDFSKLFAKELNKLSKKYELLFGESDIEEVKKIIAEKYNCSIYKTSEIISVQKDIHVDTSTESKLQSTEEKKATCNSTEKIYVNSSQLRALNFTESGLMNTIINNEEQEQQTFGEKYSNIDATLEKDIHNENHLNSNKELGLVTTRSENEDKIITNGSPITSVQSDLPKTVDQDENCSNFLNSQALIYNEKQNQVESNKTLESEISLSTDNQHSVILNEKLDSDVSHCNINDNVASEQGFHDQNNEHFLDDTMNVANSANAERSPSEGELMLEYEKHRENSRNSFENHETKDINTSSTSLNQDRVLPETVKLEEGLEEGDFDFLATIQRIVTNPEYDDDDYDINSDCDEYKYQTTAEYSSDTNVEKLHKSSVCNENVDISNWKASISEKHDQSSTIEPGQVSTNSEDENRHSLQKSPPKITDFDVAKSNFIEEDDEIIIECENINNSNISQDVKSDISNINNHSNSQISELSDLHVSSLNTHEDVNLDCQSEVQQIALLTLPPQSSLHNDSTIELVPLRAGSNTETTSSLDILGVELSVPDTNLVLSLSKNSLTTSEMKTSVSNSSNDKVSNASVSVNSLLDEETTTQPSKSVNIDFNNPNILQKFNLTREIIAPEDIKTENYATLETNDEDQTLCITLENMLKDNPGKGCDVPTVTDEQNHSNRNFEASSTSSIINEVSLPTNEAESRNNYDLLRLKALNVNVDNQVDIITEKMLDKCSAKHGSRRSIKVKNLNDMLQKPPSAPAEQVSLIQNVPPGNLPNIPEISQQNINYQLQSQSNLSVNVLPANTVIPNAHATQPLPYTYAVNQPIPDKPIQSLISMYNMLPPVPIMKNVGQHMHVPNTGLANQAPIQNNLPISAPAATNSDKQIILASSMFPRMFGSQSTSSFCSKTVFNMQLPPLQNITLPPPFTLLPSYDQSTISDKITSYKWALLEKIITTLTELDSMDGKIIKKELDILCCRQTLTEETWKFQEKILIIAQCVSSLHKLTTERSFSNIIEAIMGSIYSRVRDKNLLKKAFGTFLQLKEQGIFKSFAAEQQPLTLELGTLLQQSAIGMSSGQKEILKYQIKIYQGMLKINDNQLQSKRVPQFNNKKKKQVAVQRSSATAV